MIPLHQQKPPLSKPGQERTNLSAWIWEALSFFVSMLCISAILIILAHFDQKPLPDLGWLTINGIIGTLAGVAKAALILPLSEAISQLKWLWFWDENKPKPVSDFQLYDSASRGPWGSLCLLVRPRLIQLASLGALLTVMALAMETFLQLIPTYPIRMMPLPDHAASIGIVKNYNERAGNGPAWDQRTAPTGLKGAFQTALYSSSATAWAMQPVCPTGNCTWAPYSTLAVCSSCTNFTSLVERSVYVEEQDTFGTKGNQTTYYTLPNRITNYSGPNTPTLLQQTSKDGSTNYSLAYSHYANMTIIDAFMMYWPEGDFSRVDISPAAFECIMYFCINTYTSIVSSGRLTETLLSSWPDPTEPMPESLRNQESVRELYSIGQDVYGYDVDVKKVSNWSISFQPPGNIETAYKLDWLTLDGIRAWLSGTWAVGDTSTELFDVGSLAFNMYTTGRRESSAPTKPSVEEARILLGTMPGPDQLWSDMAQSLTSYLRSTGTDVAKGQALAAQTFVLARWAWAILPLCLLGSGLIFVITTVIISTRRNIPLWKSSSLPPLLHGLDATTSEYIIGCSTSAEDMEKRSRLHNMSMASAVNLPRMKVRADQNRCGSNCKVI